MAKDLWAAAIEVHSEILGPRAVQANPFSDDSLDAALAGNASEVKGNQIGRFLEHLLSHDAIVPAKASQALANLRKFNFNRFQGIVHAYKSVFGSRAIDNLFASDHAANVRVPEVLRNVFVHCAGSADKFFANRSTM